jgi:glucose-1-phosphate adenylyltransferase
MDLLSYSGGVQLYDRDWPIYARSPGLPPQVTGRKAALSHSMLTGGCSVNGTVENSVLFHSVTVEEGATVRYSILMPGTVVKAGAVVDYAIVAENAVIGAGAKVGTPPDGNNPDDWGVAVVAQNIKVGDGCIVPAKAMVTEDMERGLSK